MKCPSRSAPVWRKSASKSSFISFRSHRSTNPRYRRRVSRRSSVADVALSHPRSLRSRSWRLWAARKRHGGAGRRVFSEICRVNFVHGLKIAHAGEENRGLDYVGKAQLRRFQEAAQYSRARDAFVRRCRRRRSGPLLGSSGIWPAQKSMRPAADRLRVRPDRGRGFIS